jgi:hypothetical protein
MFSKKKIFLISLLTLVFILIVETVFAACSDCLGLVGADLSSCMYSCSASEIETENHGDVWPNRNTEGFLIDDQGNPITSENPEAIPLIYVNVEVANTNKCQIIGNGCGFCGTEICPSETGGTTGIPAGETGGTTGIPGSTTETCDPPCLSCGTSDGCGNFCGACPAPTGPPGPPPSIPFCNTIDKDTNQQCCEQAGYQWQISGEGNVGIGYEDALEQELAAPIKKDSSGNIVTATVTVPNPNPTNRLPNQAGLEEAVRKLFPSTQPGLDGIVNSFISTCYNSARASAPCSVQIIYIPATFSSVGQLTIIELQRSGNTWQVRTKTTAAPNCPAVNAQWWLCSGVTYSQWIDALDYDYSTQQISGVLLEDDIVLGNDGWLYDQNGNLLVGPGGVDDTFTFSPPESAFIKPSGLRARSWESFLGKRDHSGFVCSGMTRLVKAADNIQIPPGLEVPYKDKIYYLKITLGSPNQLQLTETDFFGNTLQTKFYRDSNFQATQSNTKAKAYQNKLYVTQLIGSDVYENTINLNDLDDFTNPTIALSGISTYDFDVGEDGVEYVYLSGGFTSSNHGTFTLPSPQETLEQLFPSQTFPTSLPSRLQCGWSYFYYSIPASPTVSSPKIFKINGETYYLWTESISYTYRQEIIHPTCSSESYWEPRQAYALKIGKLEGSNLRTFIVNPSPVGINKVEKSGDKILIGSAAASTFQGGSGFAALTIFDTETETSTTPIGTGFQDNNPVPIKFASVDGKFIYAEYGGNIISGWEQYDWGDVPIFQFSKTTAKFNLETSELVGSTSEISQNPIYPAGDIISTPSSARITTQNTVTDPTTGQVIIVSSNIYYSTLDCELVSEPVASADTLDPQFTDSRGERLTPSTVRAPATGLGFCLGDDPGEQYFQAHRQCSGHFCDTDTNDIGICDKDSDCVFNGKCYSDIHTVADTFFNGDDTQVRTSEWWDEVSADINQDGFREFCDPGTWQGDCESEESTLVMCQDGRDNDCDGLTDCEDPQCGATIYGVVQNSDNENIFDANVDLLEGSTSSYSDRTDTSGNYQINNVVCDTTYSAIATATSYVSSTISPIPVSPLEILNIDFTGSFALVSGSTCQDDCTYAADNTVHKECNGINGCQFYDSTAADVCNLAQPGWIRDYSPTKVIECAEGAPIDKIETKADVTCDEGNLLKITKIVTYKGKLAKLVIVTCG